MAWSPSSLKKELSTQWIKNTCLSKDQWGGIYGKFFFTGILIVLEIFFYRNSDSAFGQAFRDSCLLLDLLLLLFGGFFGFGFFFLLKVKILLSSRLWTRLWSHPCFCSPRQFYKWLKEEHCQCGNWKEPTTGWSVGPRSSGLEALASMAEKITRLRRQGTGALGITVIAGCGVPKSKSGWVSVSGHLCPVSSCCASHLRSTVQIICTDLQGFKELRCKRTKIQGKNLFVSCTHDCKSYYDYSLIFVLVWKVL